MKDTKFRILLDIHEVRSQATIPVKVGDVSCKIYITLVEGGKPYKIHENSFGVFTGKKGDNNPIFNNCIIENGIIRYDFTPQTVAAAGVLECEIRIYDEDGGVLTTPSFNIVVDERAVNDSELASAPEFAFLDEILVNEGQRIENERNRNEAFNNLGIDLEDDGEVISIVKTDTDGSQEKASFLKYAGVIPPVTATATGSAITIESSQAPLQNLKLYGKTTQDGTPTPEAPVPLVSVGDSGSFEVGVYSRNLLDVDVTTRTVNGFTFTVNADKSITVKGIASTETNFALNSNTKITLPKGKYKCMGDFYLRLYKADGSYLSNVYNQTFEINDDTQNQVFPHIYISPNKDVDKTYYPMILLAEETDTTYEPCNKQSITFTDTLRGIGDIADEKDFARGVKIQRIYRGRVSDFSTSFLVLPNGNNGLVVTMWNKIEKLRNALICSHAIEEKTTITYKEGTCYENGVNIVICGNSTDTLDTLKAKYGEAIIQYELKKPIETPLTETELNAYRHLMTNKGTTTISSEADTEITYYVNKPNAQAIGSLHEQINKDYLKLQQAIISTGGN